MLIEAMQMRFAGIFARIMRAAGLCVGAVLVCATFSSAALAQCSSPIVGRWTNLKANADPGVIDIFFAECGDTSNTETRFGTRVWVKQSSGQWFGRPSVAGHFVTDKGKRWLFARVPTGGYLDKMWMRNNGANLRVFIFHESLDSKPSAQSWHDYKKS
jgi:hypothetical protein